jgi:hypothetical protein
MRGHTDINRRGHKRAQSKAGTEASPGWRFAQNSGALPVSVAAVPSVVLFCALFLSACGAEPPTPLTRAAFDGRTTDVLRTLAANPGGTCDALTWAARGGQPSTILAITGRGVNPDTCRVGVNDWTPLMHAIHKDQVSAVAALIKAGSNVNATAAHAFTPLMMAVGNGNLAIVRLLLAAGADPHATAPNGTNAFTVAVMGGALTDIDHPLLGACHPDIIRELLAKAPDLTLAPGARARFARATARLNGCDEVLRLLDQ